MTTFTRRRSRTVAEYHQMIEAGILTPEDRVELLAGHIIETSPPLPPHAATTHRAASYLSDLLRSKAMVRQQLPVTLPPKSEPEPDIAVVRWDARDYLEGHPTPADIFLVVEVADTTLASDRQQKALIYAQAQIPEYWILAVNQQQVYVFRQPGVETYGEEMVLAARAGVFLTPVAFPEVQVDLGALFPG